MADNVNRLFAPVNRYTPGAPVLISASRYEADPNAGTCFAQVLLRSIDPRIITEATVALRTFAADGTLLEDIPGFELRNLQLKQGEIAGQQTVIPLQDPRAAGMVTRCVSVRFDDGSAWDAAPTAVWIPLKPQPKLEEALGDRAAEFRTAAAPEGIFLPQEQQDLWLCTCGAINREQRFCPNCGSQKERLFAALEPPAVAPEQPVQAPVQPEQPVQAPVQPVQAPVPPEQPVYQAPAQPPVYQTPVQQSAYRAPVQAPVQPVYQAPVPQAPAEEKKKSKLGLILGLVGGGVVLLAGLAVAFLLLILPRLQYNKAVEYAAQHDIDSCLQAAEIFESLGDFQDSALLADRCRNEADYLQAKKDMKAGNYLAAYERFTALDDYGDAAQLAADCKQEADYQKATEAMAEGNFAEAYALFQELEDFRDARTLAEDCRVKATAQTIRSYGPEDYESAEEYYYTLDEDTMYLPEVQEALWEVGYARTENLYNAGDLDAADNMRWSEWAYVTPEDKQEQTNELMDNISWGLYPDKVAEGDWSYSYTDFFYAQYEEDGDPDAYELFLRSIHNYNVYHYEDEEKCLSNGGAAWVLEDYFNTNYDFYLTLMNSALSELAEHRCYDECRLVGEWRDGGTYFTMEASGTIHYNLPWFEYGDYYGIYEKNIFLYPDEDEDARENLFAFTFVDENTVTFYCYDDDSSHTLTKVS